MIQNIITIASCITALIVILTAVLKIYKFIRNIENKIEYFDKGLKTNTLSTLRLVIINEDMPIEERINAGAEYVLMGGNGAIHAKYDMLVEEYKKRSGKIERKN